MPRLQGDHSSPLGSHPERERREALTPGATLLARRGKGFQLLRRPKTLPTRKIRSAFAGGCRAEQNRADSQGASVMPLEGPLAMADDKRIGGVVTIIRRG